MVIALQSRDWVMKNGREYRRFGWFQVIHHGMDYDALTEWSTYYKRLGWFADDRRPAGEWR